MITNQKKYNYNALFDKANKALALDPDECITSINEYFTYIADLAAKDLKFTILPLDEETFDIDANTRRITIPNSFKNGVGVQGDQAAEIVYFKIDRYFDATDLNTQNIYVEWENANKEKGLSKEYVRDVESDPDHIIFGWPLVSQITEKAGTVTFAVRFYSLQKNAAGEDEIVYSFATQPASVLINNTLNFNLTDNSVQKLEDNVLNMIKNRFQNSEEDTNSGEIEAPKFVVDLVSGPYDIKNNDGYDSDETSYSLLVSATQPSAKIDYVLRRAEPGTNNWETAIPAEVIYRPSTDTEYNTEKTYYRQVIVDNVLAYEVISEDQFDDIVERFEIYGLGKVAAPGDYMIQARARRGKSRATGNSKIVNFPYPVAPVLVEGSGNVFDDNGQCELKVEFKDNIIPTGTLIYEWHDGTNTIEGGNTLTTPKTDKEEVIYTVNVKNSRNNAETEPVATSYRVTKPAQTPQITYPTEQTPIAVNSELTISVNTEVPYDSIKVEWFKANDLNMDDLSNDISVQALKDLAESKYIPTTSGLYYAKVVLNRGVSSAEAISAPYLVM